MERLTKLFQLEDELKQLRVEGANVDQAISLVEDIIGNQKIMDD